MKKILQILTVILSWIYLNCFVEAEVKIIYDTGVNISYYLNATENSSWEYFTWVWSITITDGDQAITILDRNLWAITNVPIDIISNEVIIGDLNYALVIDAQIFYHEIMVILGIEIVIYMVRQIH